jgi:hypothetical protein
MKNEVSFSKGVAQPVAITTRRWFVRAIGRPQCPLFLHEVALLGVVFFYPVMTRLASWVHCTAVPDRHRCAYLAGQQSKRRKWS